MKKEKMFRIMTYLSFVPFIGFFIALFGSWGVIYKETKNRLRIALHFFLLILFSSVFMILYAVCTKIFLTQLEQYLMITLILVFGYVLFLIMAILSIIIAKAIVKKHNSMMMQ